MRKAANPDRKSIPVAQTAKRWLKDPAFRAAYEAPDEEFEFIREAVKARAKAGLTQEEVAKRMQTTQAAVARLEGGSVMPSTRTLKRFAQATGHRLKISFVPER